MQKIWNIPSPPRLVRFAEKEFCDGLSFPFPVDEGSLIGRQIFTILTDQRLHKAPSTEHESALRILLSDTLAKRSPDLVKLSRINLYLEELFKRALVIWVKAQVQIGSNRYQSVVNFLRFYGL